MCHNDVVIDTQEHQSGGSGSFPVREGCDLLFSVNIVNLSSRWVGGGGLEQSLI